MIRLKHKEGQKPYLSLKGIDRFFGITKALQKVDLDIYEGEVIGLVGPNGAGKSTMMKILTGVLPKTAGQIIYNGVPEENYNAKIAKQIGVSCAYQDLSLCTNLSIFENFAMLNVSHSIAPSKNWRNKTKTEVEKLLEKYFPGSNIDVTKPIETLSLTDRQVVEICKTLMADHLKILILDEPQKMGKEDSATQKALKKFNPLFTLNYSATHAKQHNLIYALDALDAYNKRLVKKIEVKGFEVKNLRGTDKYLYLESIIISPKNPPRAKVELEVKHQSGTKREFRTLDVSDNLYYISGEMEQYKGFVVSEIDPITGVVTFTNGDTIRKGDVTGDVSEDDMRRVQIRETIISHFEKEQELFKMGIKTLSLFFIDEVAKYRQYDEDGDELLGEYGKIFEQEYMAVMNEYRSILEPEYTAYLDATDVHDVHKGYFSIDKKGHSVNSSVKRGTDMSDDISAYDLILKNKEARHGTDPS